MKFSSRWSAIALVVFVVRPAMAQPVPTAKIDEFVRAEMARQKIPGVAIAVVKKGEVAKIDGYGYANVEHQVPVTPATIFQSGSLGKQFTSTAVMLQVEDGKLALSDSITKYFPDAPETWRAITVEHLLTHTSGIPDYTDGTIDYRKDYTEDQLAKFAYGLKLEFPAGSRWNYSNTGYVLLGVIVHKVSGSFYGDVLASRVFKPIGMTTARIIDEADIVPNRAAGYHLVKGELKNQEWVAPRLNTTADGSLYFSARDMVAWDKAVRTRAVLKPESWQRILTPVRLTSGKSYPYGFGWSITERAEHPLHSHGGSWQGFKTQYSRFLGDDLSIIVLANAAQANPERFADGIAGLINERLAPPVLKPTEDKEPKVTARLEALLQRTRDGLLTPSEFAYMRAGFFPDGAKAYRERLRELGPAGRLVLVERNDLGDDRVYTYQVGFGARTMYYTVALAPDDKIAQFSLREQR